MIQNSFPSRIVGRRGIFVFASLKFGFKNPAAFTGNSCLNEHSELLSKYSANISFLYIILYIIWEINMNIAGKHMNFQMRKGHNHRGADEVGR